MHIQEIISTTEINREPDKWLKADKVLQIFTVLSLWWLEMKHEQVLY